MCTTDRTVEENPPAPSEHWPPVEKIVWRSGWRAALSHLRAATADGPVRSEDGSLAVIRTDRVRVWQSNDEWWFCDAYDHGPFCRRCERVSERVASRLALLAAPAPADPEEDGDG